MQDGPAGLCALRQRLDAVGHSGRYTGHGATACPTAVADTTDILL